MPAAPKLLGFPPLSIACCVVFLYIEFGVDCYSRKSFEVGWKNCIFHTSNDVNFAKQKKITKRYSFGPFKFYMFEGDSTFIFFIINIFFLDKNIIIFFYIIICKYQEKYQTFIWFSVLNFWKKFLFFKKKCEIFLVVVK